MTPEEILRDLRDIQLPEQAADAIGAGFVLWPTALVALATLLAVWLAFRRRSTWRREIVGHLDAIERSAADGRAFEGWTDLAILLRRIALQLCDRREIASLIGDAWLEKLDHLFETDVFSAGPGRGVITFPYGD
ncbi:MAG: DUF4381 domain-containing protein, partial [Alphaproteobacteria bacterium]|nr:DUF4381 domain-containing protein [Alphaproteobacteria bacterium]